jgi:hypothetical protein
MRRSGRVRRSRALVALGIVAGLLMGAPTPGAAETNPYERGPAPTASSVVEREGPLAYAQVKVVGSSAIGFARGTVWYPVEGGPYAVVVAVPGVVWPGSFLAWIGPYLASNGFVVMTLDPFSAFDGTASRADQVGAAARWLTTAGPHAVRSRVDPGRLGAVGHGVAVGAVLDLAGDDAVAGLRATVDLGPAPLQHQFSDARGHEAATLSWLKRHLDDDARYEPYICPAALGDGVAAHPTTCDA